MSHKYDPDTYLVKIFDRMGRSLSHLAKVEDSYTAAMDYAKDTVTEEMTFVILHTMHNSAMPRKQKWEN